jgi:hypothetical protein
MLAEGCKILSRRKHATQNSQRLMMWNLENSIKIGISNRFAALNYSDVNTDINKAWANIRQNIKILQQNLLVL